ncbi:MAG: NmrA family NAD(P)-binding protein [Caulobacteraceae bacterium]
MALVAVFGASGRQGMAQVRQLLAAGHEVRAISRRADPFLGAGYEARVVPADIYDEASLVAAMEGVDGAFYTQPLRARGNRVDDIARLGRAAKAAGVKRFVWNTSSWIPDKAGDPFSYAGNTRGINALWRSGVPATVFGSVLFMDNLLTNWAFPFIVGEGRYVYPHRADLEANWISLDDVAKFMIAALDRPDLEGAWLNIGGAERLKPPEVASILSKVVGREVRYDPCTPAEFGKLLTGAFGNEMDAAERAAVESFMEAFYTFNNTSPLHPFEVDMAPVLARIPIELETMETWAARQDWRPTNTARPPAG